MVSGVIGRLVVMNIADLIVTGKMTHSERMRKMVCDLFISPLEMGLSGAWTKFMRHHTFIWSFKGKSGWKLIPEQEHIMATQEEFSKSEKFWRNFKLCQLWCFIVLNNKIHTAAVQSKWRQPSHNLYNWKVDSSLLIFQFLTLS